MPAIQALLKLTARSATNNASSPLQVICAFPVSGQYGPGSRILYYVLVITCIFARKAEWLRGACLAAALIFPAVAALHACVLASSHVNGAVDMDIFGAFQFCSIAILAAPLTVRLSRTYFYDPGRNVIFLWTILILAGLIALCVEFYRATPIGCNFDATNGPKFGVKDFPYANGNVKCGLVCSQQDGPISPLRGGAANEIFIIPIPARLTFNAAMLLAAGFCIPAILSLIFTWDKILEINWKRRREAENLNEPVEGANVTVGELKGINSVVRMFLSVVEIPVFGGAVTATLAIGEANFFSPQVRWQTEPMASIGQWAPIVGTVLAAFGSLYLLWYKEEKNDEEKTAVAYPPSDYSHHDSDRHTSPSRASDVHRSSGVADDNALGIHFPSSINTREIYRIPTITEPVTELIEGVETDDAPQNNTTDVPTAGRPRVRKWLTEAANKMGNAAHDKLDVSDYNDQKAHSFPEIPGEPLRNPGLERVSMQYSQLREQNVRAESTYAASVNSVLGQEDASTPPASHTSPRLEISPSRKPKRRDTLEVPTPVHIHRRTESH